MHGENVRVRKQDAIVIDFAHATTGPRSADLASLEVWLTFKFSPELAASRRQWHDATEFLYRPESVEMATTDGLSVCATESVQACLETIRSLARGSIYSWEEYQRVLAVYLLRHASFPADSSCAEEDEYRRTYAYWLANRMAIALCAKSDSNLEAA